MDKPKFSSNILAMKFMKRTNDKIAKEQEELQNKLIFGEAEKKQSSKYDIIKEDSMATIRSFQPGRQSYGGMNVYIEKFNNKGKNTMDPEERKMDGIDDEEMAERYALNETIDRRLDSKKRKSSDHNPRPSKKKRSY